MKLMEDLMNFSLLAAAKTGSAGMIGSFLPLILIFAIFYVLLIMPQQKQKKQHKLLIESLKKGDKIITGSGVYGEISKVDPTTVDIEISKGIIVRLSKDSVATKR